MNNDFLEYDCDRNYEACQKIIQNFFDEVHNQTQNQNNSIVKAQIFINISSENLCNCIYFVNECAIASQNPPGQLEPWINNVYLALYVLVVVMSLVVISLALYPLISYHKNLTQIEIVLKVYTRIKASITKKQTDFTKVKASKRIINSTRIGKNHTKKLNAASDFLIFSLLFSYLIIVLYVVPNQAYIFYFNNNTLTANCKSSEFIKAFAVSASIYCLGALALQRLFAIKFSKLYMTHIRSKLIYSISYQSCSCFISSLLDLAYAFFFSPYYRQYLTTTLLVISKWIISISIGLYNMSLYSTTNNILEGEEMDLPTKKLINCTVISSKTTCMRNNNNESISDILFVVVLLIMPNLIVFSSYSWICYHVYSNSVKFKKSVDAIRIKSMENKQSLNMEKKISPKCNDNKQELELKEKISLVPLGDEITKYGSNSSIKKGLANNYKNSTQLFTNNILNTNSQISINKRNKSLILTTCLMVICFTLCWTPFFILPMLHKLIDTKTYNNLKVIIHLIGYSSAIWNPIILMIKTKRYKVRQFNTRLGKLNFFSSFQKQFDVRKLNAPQVNQ